MDFGGNKNQLTQLGEARIWRFLIQICQALEVIHDKGIVHADLKPQNVLLSGTNYDPKLTDFGISQKLSKGYGYVHDQSGTLPYCSPEVLRGQKYNAKTDIWAFGCLIYELCARRRCFSQINENELTDTILSYDVPSLPPNDRRSLDLEEIYKFCMMKDQEDRPSAAQILGLPCV